MIEGKLRNYLVPFLGAKTDIRNIPSNKWMEWEAWRREQTRHGKPKADTIANEMGIIREFWRWAMENSYIPSLPNSRSTTRTSLLMTRFVGHLGGSGMEFLCAEGAGVVEGDGNQTT